MILLIKIMAKFIGLDKLARLFSIIKDNGGIRGSLRALYRFVKKNIHKQFIDRIVFFILKDIL